MHGSQIRVHDSGRGLCPSWPIVVATSILLVGLLCSIHYTLEHGGFAAVCRWPLKLSHLALMLAFVHFVVNGCVFGPRHEWRNTYVAQAALVLNVAIGIEYYSVQAPQGVGDRYTLHSLLIHAVVPLGLVAHYSYVVGFRRAPVSVPLAHVLGFIAAYAMVHSVYYALTARWVYRVLRLNTVRGAIMYTLHGVLLVALWKSFFRSPRAHVHTRPAGV